YPDNQVGFISDSNLLNGPGRAGNIKILMWCPGEASFLIIQQNDTVHGIHSAQMGAYFIIVAHKKYVLKPILVKIVYQNTIDLGGLGHSWKIYHFKLAITEVLKITAP